MNKVEIRNDQVYAKLASSHQGGTVKDFPNDADKPQESEADKQYTSKEIGKAVDNLNKLLESNQTHLKFRMHDKLKEYYVEIINDVTDEVIKEIPSKKLMDVAAKIQEMVGLLVDEKM
ncbi:flagellar protein FlaG [Brevibacillus fluminis]|uniref:flagellar protein FlaG n=1 Tax=Brevibacillus fluminis TaxID=511487 RepID=UPI003F8B434E